MSLYTLNADEPSPSDHYDALIQLIFSDDFSAVAEYLEDHEGMDINEANDGVTALFYACSTGDKGLVQLFLDKGADPNAISPYGTAAHWAAEKRHMDVVTLLIDHGFNPRIEEMSYWMSFTGKIRVPCLTGLLRLLNRF